MRVKKTIITSDYANFEIGLDLPLTASKRSV